MTRAALGDIGPSVRASATQTAASTLPAQRAAMETKSGKNVAEPGPQGDDDDGDLIPAGGDRHGSRKEARLSIPSPAKRSSTVMERRPKEQRGPGARPETSGAQASAVPADDRRSAGSSRREPRVVSKDEHVQASQHDPTSMGSRRRGVLTIDLPPSPSETSSDIDDHDGVGARRGAAKGQGSQLAPRREGVGTTDEDEDDAVSL